ncbi:Alpha/beta hydrolase fold [Parasponia andersonii]|uniref:Alpha/beta hydrolase fold n=1 Tax=Parasponia andersonii TaxID=3476 RepID=A0A2P5DEY1_PARAD|nr:Alpha/beta hydrolase fold [Parasponia andersonii]
MASDSLSTGFLTHLKLQQPKPKKERKSFSLGPNNGLNTHTNNGKPKAFSPSLCSSNKYSLVVTKFSSSAAETAVPPPVALGVGEIKEKCKKWLWKGQFSISYFISHPHEEEGKQESGSGSNSNPPLLLVHGFGASIPHWRRNIRTLAQNNTVYAIDLLGFGASDKPAGFSYTMETWAELILDFLDEIVQKPTVLVGNSVGSLACLIAASESSQSLVRGLVLLNCAGGMNNKAIVDDWRIKLLLPLLWLVDFLLKQQGIASFIFERVRQRESLRNILLSVYRNKESVDDELVEIIIEPTFDQGALDAFVSIVTGPPGPSPVKLIPKISLPVLVLWGNEDPFTPLDGPVGKYFSSLPAKLANISLFVLDGVGHCPHDDRPELVHEKLLPWLAHLPASLS